MEWKHSTAKSPRIILEFLLLSRPKRRESAGVVRYVYDFKKANFDALRKALSVTPLDMGLDESDIDQCWGSWRDLFLNAVESFIPKIRLKDAKCPR